MQVLEKRGRLQSRPSPDDDRAYCMMVNPRGTESLLAAGMDLSALAESANGQLSMSQPWSDAVCLQPACITNIGPPCKV